MSVNGKPVGTAFKLYSNVLALQIAQVDPRNAG
jgi:hypothetical protein